MKCFYHHDNIAVAICKSCSRAVCPVCAVDVPPGIACINRCENDVESLNIMILRGKTSYEKAGKSYKRNAIATLITGLVFFSWGVLPIILIHNYRMVPISILGLVFLLWSYFSYLSGKQIGK